MEKYTRDGEGKEVCLFALIKMGSQKNEARSLSYSKLAILLQKYSSRIIAKKCLKKHGKYTWDDERKEVCLFALKKTGSPKNEVGSLTASLQYYYKNNLV